MSCLITNAWVTIFYLRNSAEVGNKRMETLIIRYFKRSLSIYQRKKISRLPNAYWLPSLIQFIATLFLIQYTTVVCFSFKEGDFLLLKHSTSVNDCKSNNQSAVVHRVIIHKSVHSFLAREPVNVASLNFIKTCLCK